MAHYAELDDSHIVLRVVVIDNESERDIDGNPSEAAGVAWCQNFFGGGVWIKTSYNKSIRKNFAGIGFSYDAGRDAFLMPSPYPSWVLDEETGTWFPPVARPENGGPYAWREENLSWELV